VKRDGDKLPAPGWAWDATKHHQSRYWDGSKWTAKVIDGAVEAVDPRLPLSPPTRTTALPDPSLPAGGPDVVPSANGSYTSRVAWILAAVWLACGLPLVPVNVGLSALDTSRPTASPWIVAVTTMSVLALVLAGIAFL